MATSTLAPFYGDYVAGMLGQGSGLASLPYQAYEGQRYADPTALTQQYESGIAGMQTPAAFSQAQGILSGAAQGVGGISYSPSTLSAANTGDVNSFMNPYQQAVTDIGKREAIRTDQIAGNDRRAQAVRAGAFGGSRQGIQEAEANRNLGMRLDDIQAKGANDAYVMAMNSLDRERTADNSNAQFGANLGLQQGQALTGIASGMSNVGYGQNQADVNRLNLTGSAAQQQQTRAQNPLDFGYGQWQESKAYPYQQLQFQQGLLSGLPLSVPGSATSSDPYSQALQAALGTYSLLSPKTTSTNATPATTTKP